MTCEDGFLGTKVFACPVTCRAGRCYDSFLADINTDNVVTLDEIIQYIDLHQDVDPDSVKMAIEEWKSQNKRFQ